MYSTSTIALERSMAHAPAPPASDSVAAGSLPDILYIMGTGRSGTTILEILLANNPGITGVGELKHIFRDGFLRDLPCACGRSGRQCELWSAVLQATGWDREDWREIGQVIEKLESHKRFPFVWAGLGAGRSMPLYRQASEALFNAVGAVKHSQVIVDSSKYAGRALMLARLFPDRVKVLCITRSAAGMLQAFAKKHDDEQRPKSSLAAAAYYLYVLLCMWSVQVRLRERCFAIRFEDLNRDPAATLDAIEAWSGYSLAMARARVAAGNWFDVGHIVTGNRLRRQGRVRFDPGPAETFQRERATPARLLVRLLEAYRGLLGF